MTPSSSSSTSPSPPPSSKKRKRDAKVQPVAVVDDSDDSDSDAKDDADSGSDEDSDDENEPAGSENVAGDAPSDDEDIVLSHAERRRQKKQERKSIALDKSSPSKKRKLEDGTSAPASSKKSSKAKDPKATAKQKRQNSVWVGNLAFKTTPDALKGFFDGVGEITRVHMPMKAGSQEDNMGFAYVDFASPDVKVIAITLSERDFQGRKLLIKDGDDFTGRPAAKPTPTEPSTDPNLPSDPSTASTKPAVGQSKFAQKTLRNQKQPPAPTLFFGNLGFETTDEDLKALVEMHRHKPGKGKGREEAKGEDEGEDKAKEGEEKFAFIDFTSVQHATDALTNPRVHRLQGRELVVEYASAEAVRRGGGPRVAGAAGSGERGMGGRGGTRGGRDGGRGGKPRGGKWERGTRDSTRTNQWEQNGGGDDHDGDGHVEEQGGESETQSRFGRGGGRGGDRGRGRGRGSDRFLSRSRAKPGAALAQAPRESAAIIPSSGQKITF
ncbi:hypothetical protein SERLA73DRAFT_166802 [Serpula lacrymans var. lacrymans S7.3]|uniref:RRM domain-containing protein n=1 Tax=Serpula lacrymans var. lacrymans (strain S7.3) TaxID=936435 RepID=F8PR68_SERL3|nr:hypothetical protein SERLA73DRAFT_166802 [Serpula lacrymans var. lacrymans S7.3]